MSDIIRLLPDALANQIAAGEVVQRPSSVVKELMENAIDAGAKNISLIITEAGKGQIRVVDDGSGMTGTDARLSLERHATSKISSSEDLFSIRTMGFRGEALASIAAVSQMQVKTRKEDTELGTVIEVAASEVIIQEPCQCEKGTSVSVKNLFYNVPARRNFLKSNGVEMKHVVEEFQRIALAYPEVGFSMYQEDEETHRLDPGKLSQRIVGLFGKNYAAQLASCTIDAEFIKIKGYVGRPEFARKTRGEQYLFVNNRYIKSHYLNHAVTMAFEGMMPEKYFPFYCLFIEIDPIHIDVNVHPTKTEIKFDDERTVYSIVRSAVKQALGIHNITPSLNFSADINL
ncbi:MAG: DNA mismatch repair endonuclease MutL, partial [Cyclobacteriaceae bacterium]|nr:DNA mismatch repair endonuclease MutL [Cyclobacteriaceae bacterium]